MECTHCGEAEYEIIRFHAVMENKLNVYNEIILGCPNCRHKRYNKKIIHVNEFSEITEY